MSGPKPIEAPGDPRRMPPVVRGRASGSWRPLGKWRGPGNLSHGTLKRDETHAPIARTRRRRANDLFLNTKGDLKMTARQHDVMVATGDGVSLAGTLGLPEPARRVVLFAHGSGSSRHSPRNRFVARFLERYGFATLLIDLSTAAEEETERTTRHLRFDIGFLAKRLGAATAWLERDHQTRALAIGYFGASTGAAAALVAAKKSSGSCPGSARILAGSRSIA
jgi:hypothetical protein